MLESIIEPLIIVLTLWGLAIWFDGELLPNYLIFSVIIFSVTFPGNTKINIAPWKIIRNILVSWLILASMLLTFALATHHLGFFDKYVMQIWLWLTPICQIIAVFALRGIAPFILQIQGPTRYAIIAGMNKQGISIAASLQNSEYNNTECLGFFDDRSADRLSVELDGEIQHPILGKITDITEYMQQHQVDIVYMSLPMENRPRIVKVLDELKDTTASIYFLPDIFLTDLIQGSVGQVDGIPVITLCETPFAGIDGLIKRVFDLLFSVAALILISPILLIISLGVKMSSPGPVIFKQRRYGLDGKEILVYKFRTMTVAEDGAVVVQATKQDQRITPFGRLLRKTSLDELPQFINVLQGRMSVVGPRPHAVAHNETYRKIIKGYMVRHKVRPGITGWAQVNGFRGETDTLEKMQSRIEYDIDYLRNWSAKLDIYIVLKTIAMLLRKEKNAY
ncbi:undecaprenyl-phosphate glucose phosphotransferase [Candidatus Methylopumilus turicensis]|uniref:undecaprenyl-phosphate glucose phosphotransferase n=1 Tax=Candidatus Methylopumilus turicensis TaxID=1581680 RepID=UPI001E330585